jgi:hypothetical protein
MRWATSENTEKLQPAPSYEAPRGYQVPGQMDVLTGVVALAKLGYPTAESSPRFCQEQLMGQLLWCPRGPLDLRRCVCGALHCESVGEHGAWKKMDGRGIAVAADSAASYVQRAKCASARGDSAVYIREQTMQGFQTRVATLVAAGYLRLTPNGYMRG